MIAQTLKAALQPTRLLDFEHSSIRKLLDRRNWKSLQTYAAIGAIYDFVRDEIAFGYNSDDAIPASQVLRDGYGQCNTKTILLMALLRATGIPCVLHAATIRKRLQKGIVTGLWYWLAPNNIIHTWVEVQVDGHMTSLEGVILDNEYIKGLRCMLPLKSGALLGYGVGTDHWEAPPIDWHGESTAIQQTGVNQQLGMFDTPDAFYQVHGSNLSGVRSFIFRHLVRHLMNFKVARIRKHHAASILTHHRHSQDQQKKAQK